MNTFSSWLQQLRQWLRTLTAICLLFLLTTWTLPAQAASNIDRKLEQQVLEIIRKNPQIVVESIQIYQQQQQQKIQTNRERFLQDLKANPQAVIGNSPTTGSPTPKILVIEFSDFECPYCGEAQKTLDSLMAKYGDKVQLVYKNFPLSSIHKQAIPAATAALAAHKQGLFWEYDGALFNNQDDLGETLYLDIAQKLNLDLEKFNRDRTIVEKEVARDTELATNLGLSGTPFFIIQSEKASGAVQLSELQKILEDMK
ncbi:DsbA family protein [Calothrix rhizosoleniae]|uniref:DsbA family protein n=1 Tax=Calothrix rhizosoleniae TaxID=888997 RepID=UPI000B49E9E8|nr:thioredoxin domain-containing protein [Calothrix rhizosoleniae]